MPSDTSLAPPSPSLLLFLVLSPAWQEACERSLAEMESSHQQVMEELQRHHQRELERLRQEKERLLAEEAAATAAGRSGCFGWPWEAEKVGEAQRAEGMEEELQKEIRVCSSSVSSAPWVGFPRHAEQAEPDPPLSLSAAIEALKKAHREEMNKELGRTRSFQQCGSSSDALQKQHQ